MPTEAEFRKAFALKNMFRTVKTKRSADGTLLQNNYNSIGSMERGEPVPRTRNVFRKSTELGEEQCPKAVTLTKLWTIMYGPQQEKLRIIRMQLFKNTRKIIDYISFDGQHYLMWTNFVEWQVLRSACYLTKEDLMAAYRSGTVKYIECSPLGDITTASG